MDQERTIRYVTPPAFFYGSLLLGAWFADPCRLVRLAENEFLHMAAAVAASLFPLGFLIAGISTLLLRLSFSLFSKHSYEIMLSGEAWNRIWATCDFPDKLAQSSVNKIIAAQTFDHEMLPAQTHACAERLWSAFNIAAHSAVAVAISLPVGHWILPIGCSVMWLACAASTITLLAVIAVCTWRRHMAFLEFQTHRQFSKLDKSKTEQGS